jgi:hypothetical protein
VLPTGAIAMYQNQKEVNRKIIPYWSNLAICGLATEIKLGNSTNKQELTSIGWKALDWYKSKQDQTTGIVTDYIWNKDGEKSTGTMDSVDSYSATFLSAIACMNKATGDGNKAKEYAGAIDLAVKSIINLQDTDGLTWSKDSYKVKFLMDNTEVANGLREIQNVLQFNSQNETLSKSKISLEKLQNAIQSKMWNESKKSYKWGIQGNLNREFVNNTDWSKYYPDALANIWPSALGNYEKTTRNKKSAESFSSNAYKYKELGTIEGVWNPFVGLAFYNNGKVDKAKGSLDYGYKMLASNKLGSLYTSGHAGVSLILYYKTTGNQSLFW